MAVKKTSTKAKKEPIVEVTVDEEIKEVVSEVEEKVEDVEEKKSEVKKGEPIIEVNEDKVDTSKIATPTNVRIKMKTDHKCCIGGEFYVFKKGSCYNVPKEVKMRLAKAGVLLPL